MVSFLVGLVAVAFVQRVVERGRLAWFGWYCIVLGLVVIALNWPR